MKQCFVAGRSVARLSVSTHCAQGMLPRICWPEMTPGGSPANICFNSFLEMFSPCTHALEPDFKALFDTFPLSHRPAGEGHPPPFSGSPACLPGLQPSQCCSWDGAERSFQMWWDQATVYQ